MPDFTPDERDQAVFPDLFNPDGSVKQPPHMDIPSSDGSSTYRVGWDRNTQKMTCTCPHWTYRLSVGNQKCKHIIQAEAQGLKPPDEPALPAVKRYPREIIKPVVVKALELVKPFCLRAVVCGSYRRNKPTVKDLDILVLMKDMTESLLKAMKAAVKAHSDIVILDGNQRFTVELSGVQVDYRIAPKEEWVFQLLHMTGSVEENVRLRQKALSYGWSLSEHGLVNKDTREDVLDSPSDEAEVYMLLREPYRRPEER